MSDGPAILLTNDDGIDAPGIATLRTELTALGDVTVVAPDANQSGVGRTRSHTARIREHPWGYRLSGTPADCVAYGLRGLETDFDVVVSGVNNGPNAGNYVVGRSGTVGAGIEAAFLGTPALAISAYHSTDFFLSPPEEYDFARPARIAARLVSRALESGVYDDVDLLNVNAPVDAPSPPVILTEPYHDYGQHVEPADPETLDEGEIDADGGELAADEQIVHLHDRTWPGVVGWENPFPPTDEHRERYPVGTDRRAMVDASVSVSPLAVTHASPDSAALAEVVETIDVE
ncbi:5'/3'-nucleotidase SurE [Halobellus limi]|uniref:5'-nucleotidase SurE n=1 Tax=Halobellus limi TaxID=699433 RepID=A0A1H5WDJ7_9EURY|nr:5'/3'-nucleotidase SurE [Halobellus limi]QCC46473.1 5'/3'-nucleotidase SurE [Halobellus limi]SEF97534.1 5'-nucleotidase /3'-nucleotidase /exopolyphosphatase [Halobellus limi]